METNLLPKVFKFKERPTKPYTKGGELIKIKPELLDNEIALNVFINSNKERLEEKLGVEMFEAVLAKTEYDFMDDKTTIVYHYAIN